MLKNCAKAFLVLALLTVLTMAFFRNRLCEALISAATTKATGLKLSVEKINLDILSSTLEMRGITLFNPPKFEPETLGRAEEIFLKYDLLDCLRGRLHFREAKVRISEINIIRNEKGKSNVSAFRGSASKKANLSTSLGQTITAALKSQKKAKVSKQPRPKLIIDRLEVFPGKITFLDYQAEIGEPAAIIVSAKGPFVFKNVGNLSSVVNSVSAKEGLGYLLHTFSGEAKLRKEKLLKRKGGE